MRKASWVSVAVFVSSFIVSGGVVQGAEDRRVHPGLDVPRGSLDRDVATSELVLYRSEPDGVEGVFHFGEYRLSFSALRLGEESAEARFWSDDGTFVLESRIESRRDGWIRSGGVLVSGRGEIGKESLRMLDDLAGSVFGEPLSRLPLELGCRLNGRRAAPVLAAVVQPWQVIYKHTGRLTVDPAKVELSEGCSYHAPVRGRQIVLRDDEAVAYVPLFTTLDAEGAKLQALTAESNAPCGAKCRGACGADCTSPLCSVDSSGCVYTCPTHSFCRIHDACYDACNATWGCWNPITWVCKRGCDDQCLEQYSSATCAAWSQGLGGDGWGTYDECGSWGDDCTEFALVEVVRVPGITVDDGIERDRAIAALLAGDAGAELVAPPLDRPDRSDVDAFLEDAFPTRSDRRAWRQWGPDTIVALTCDDGGSTGGGGGGGGDDGTGGGGGETCTHCTCEGEFTSWEGEVCGSTADELVDECWNSCY